MIKFLTIISLLLFLISCSSPNKESLESETNSASENKLVKLIEEDQMEVLAEGFSWSEGPLWVEDLNALIFSDVPENRIYKWSEDEGLTVFLEGSGSDPSMDLKNERGSNGLALDSGGYLLLTQHGNRQLARMKTPVTAPSSDFEVLCNEFGGSRFNSPNDLTVHSNGSIFFTDPPYGLYGKDDDALKELDMNGVYRVNGDTVFLLIDSLTRPNGIALSPDEMTLYVANSDPQKAIWASYQLDKTGHVVSGDVFYDATDNVEAGMVGSQDGMKVHPNGNIYATGPGGVHVFNPQGQLLMIYRPDGFVSNCAFDKSHQWLYMTVNNRLIRVRIE